MRRYLYESGFEITEEKACISLWKAYSVMCCRYDGIVRKPSIEQEYIGSLGNNTDEATLKYISDTDHKLEFRLRGIDKSSQLYSELSRLSQTLKGYIKE